MVAGRLTLLARNKMVLAIVSLPAIQSTSII